MGEKIEIYIDILEQHHNKTGQKRSAGVGYTNYQDCALLTGYEDQSVSCRGMATPQTP